MNTDLAASIIIKNKNNVWIKDSMVTQCNACQKNFSYFVRKHHCRSCGNIFCYDCSNHSTVIPSFIMDHPNAADYWNLSYYITSLKSDKVRVCKQCYDIIDAKIKSYEEILHMFDNPLTIEQIRKLESSSNDIKNHYFDHLRNIQYYLPNHQYCNIDIKLLKINAPYFSNHSKYLVHLIKSMGWNKQNHKSTLSDRSISDRSRSNISNSVLSPISKTNVSYINPDTRLDYQSQLQFITRIINGKKNKSCCELYCTRTCQDHLSFDDCINILYSCTHDLPYELTKYLFQIIYKTPELIILCHLSFFITLIVENESNNLLKTLLYKLLSNSKKMIYHTYWFLSNRKTNANTREKINIENFINLFDKDLVDCMHDEYEFYQFLIANLNDPTKFLIVAFSNYKPISLPYDPNIKLIGVVYEDIEIKSSYTKPVVIPFITNTNTVIRLLFKKESITNDVTVLNLMTICDIILREDLDKEFSVIAYPVMPLSQNSGMIEIVENSETIYKIVSKKKSLLQHIIEKNETKIISDVLDRYTLSLVSYTLHSYFLALGDRHLQNIMITDDAAIFHIDFGYILGSNTYPLSLSDIKLNSDMLDVLGGYDGVRYKRYLELCSKGVILLRKYFNIFFILLSQDPKFKEYQITKFIMTRFQPRQPDSVVISELMTVIRQSNNAFSAYIQDFLHYHTQEKTFQNGIGGVGSILQSALGAVKNFALNSNPSN